MKLCKPCDERKQENVNIVIKCCDGSWKGGAQTKCLYAQVKLAKVKERWLDGKEYAEVNFLQMVLSFFPWPILIFKFYKIINQLLINEFRLSCHIWMMTTFQYNLTNYFCSTFVNTGWYLTHICRVDLFNKTYCQSCSSRTKGTISDTWQYMISKTKSI